VLAYDLDLAEGCQLPPSYGAFRDDRDSTVCIAVRWGLSEVTPGGTQPPHSVPNISALRTESGTTEFWVRKSTTGDVAQAGWLSADRSSGRIHLGSSLRGALGMFCPLGPLDQMMVMSLLADRQSTLVHAAGVDLGGDGLLFFGSSGAGKSTLAALWRDAQAATILGDERIAVHRSPDSFVISGTPWHSTVQKVSPLEVPLKAMFFLEHASANTADQLSPLQTAVEVHRQTGLPHWDREGVESVTDLIADIAEGIPAWRLGFVPDASALDFVRCLISR